jgi:two-component system OmpR family response regulator
METPPHHLLVVDDDREIRTLLAEHLGGAGYRVSVAADGVEMRRVLDRQAIDLIVLDLNLPREDGLTLCRNLRSHSQVPVIMLTARGEAIDRILGLEMGADDYLAKPFEPRELVARIRSVLRRAHALPKNLEPLEARRARFGDWTVDFEQRTLLDAAGRMTMLSGAEFRLLKILIDHAGRVLSREQMLALGAVAHGEALDRAIDLQISRLRQKFGAEGADLIRTVRNQGYVLAAPVTLE